MVFFQNDIRFLLRRAGYLMRSERPRTARSPRSPATLAEFAARALALARSHRRETAPFRDAGRTGPCPAAPGSRPPRWRPRGRPLMPIEHVRQTEPVDELARRPGTPAGRPRGRRPSGRPSSARRRRARRLAAAVDQRLDVGRRAAALARLPGGVDLDEDVAPGARRATSATRLGRSIVSHTSTSPASWRTLFDCSWPMKCTATPAPARRAGLGERAPGRSSRRSPGTRRPPRPSRRPGRSPW